MSFNWLHGPVRWSGSFSPAGVRNFNDNRDNIFNFGTTNIRNIAHEMGRLTPMFRSAEDYIEMWEKTRG